MTENIQDEINRARIDCRDVELDHARSLGFDLVQPKYDGWWVLVDFDGSYGTIYSTSGRPLGNIILKSAWFDGVKLIGEFMYGTNWAQSHVPGRIYIHDCITGLDGKDFSQVPYYDRLKEVDKLIHFIASDQLVLVPTFHMNDVDGLWSYLVDEQGYEGLVYKNSSSKLDPHSVWFGRTKKDFTQDFIVMGFIEGNGKHKGSLGAIECGLIVKGQLTKITRVGGGFSDNQRAVIWNDQKLYLGRVIEVTGKQLFPSGALRHPNFIRFRDDKLPERCTWPKDGG